MRLKEESLNKKSECRQFHKKGSMQTLTSPTFPHPLYGGNDDKFLSGTAAVLPQFLPSAQVPLQSTCEPLQAQPVNRKDQLADAEVFPRSRKPKSSIKMASTRGKKKEKRHHWR